MAELIDTLRGRRAANANLQVGLALHSLRAVTPEEAHAKHAYYQLVITRPSLTTRLCQSQSRLLADSKW